MIGPRKNEQENQRREIAVALSLSIRDDRRESRNRRFRGPGIAGVSELEKTFRSSAPVPPGER
jgi:hypothetical protein